MGVTDTNNRRSYRIVLRPRQIASSVKFVMVVFFVITTALLLCSAEGSTAADEMLDGMSQGDPLSTTTATTTTTVISAPMVVSTEVLPVDSVVSSLDKLSSEDLAAVQAILEVLTGNGGAVDPQHCHMATEATRKEAGGVGWARFKHEMKHEWARISMALGETRPVFQGLTYAALCALVGCLGSCMMAMVVGSCFYLAFVRGKR